MEDGIHSYIHTSRLGWLPVSYSGAHYMQYGCFGECCSCQRGACVKREEVSTERCSEGLE